jgi:ribosome-binding protein aMBF1 (putative translation factor)
MTLKEKSAFYINQLLENSGLSKARLGEIVGVTRMTVHNWCTAKTMPTSEQFNELETTFDVKFHLHLGNNYENETYLN